MRDHAALPIIDHSEFLFPSPGKSCAVGGFSRAKAKLDAIITEIHGKPMVPWVIHDLRRSCASGLQKLGFTLTVIDSVLGHTSGTRGGIVGIYNRYSYAVPHWKRGQLISMGCFTRARTQKLFASLANH